MLFFGDDFYGDEHVLRMSFEDQGVYLRLLWISKRNGGLPNDAAAVAELLGLPYRGLSVKRFLTQVWPRIARCWTAAEDGRLIQLRQEEENERRAAARADGSATDGERAKSARHQAAARARWGHRSHGGDAPTHALHDAKAHAMHDATDASAHASRILPPAPPSVQANANQPQHAHARVHDASHAHAEGANASQTAEPEHESIEDHRIGDLQAALLKTGLRSAMRPFDRSRALFALAETVAPTGIQPGDVDALWALAQDKTNDDPGGLLAHWLDAGGGWRGVLDEQDMKRKEAALKARARDDSDLLAGVYEA